MKRFNIAGTCSPEKHYMVDISNRLAVIKKMIEHGDYFCINRGRQYGKTTTLNALKKYLSNDYVVFQISFEGLGDSIFETQESLIKTLLRLMQLRLKQGQISNASTSTLNTINNCISDGSFDALDFIGVVGEICAQNRAGIVLLIDEVDQAGNYESFIKLLGLFRNMYLDKENAATFQSVILAGVYDIKNLRLKIRGESEHQYNSPWNIAVPFDEDMSLSEKGICGMLEDYESDHHTGMNTAEMAHLLREYTEGYPYLVSRLCLEMDKNATWTTEGFLRAENTVLREPNTLFDDLQKKLSQYPQMESMFHSILYNGKSYPYNYADKMMELATRFGFIKSTSNNVEISNRIFETYLYNYFVTEAAMKDSIQASWEHGLPGYLQHDLDAYKEGRAAGSTLLDCLQCELYGSINGAELDDQAISHEQAQYLRDKFLWHKI